MALTQERFVISEDTLFKHLISREDIADTDARQNLLIFFQRVPHNIFKDDYHILYDTLFQAHKYGVLLTYDFLHQILLNNMDVILSNPLVTLYNTTEMTQVDRQQHLLDHVLSLFDDLLDHEIEGDSPLSASLQFYIETWCNHHMEEVVHKQLEILQEGATVGRRHFRGAIDAKAYYDNAYSIIRSLLDSGGDNISETIDTSTMSAEEIRAQMQEDSEAEIITVTGIEEMDALYEYRKGEIIVIQAGTGVGKTRFANGMVYNATARSKNTLYFTFEQKASRVWALQNSRHTLARFGYKADVTDKSILRKTYNVENAQYVEEAHDDLVDNESLGRLRIESINLDVNDFQSKLINVWEDGFHFDTVVIDYFGLLNTRGSNRYEALTDMVNTLKSDVKSFKGEGFLCIVLNQLTKEAEKTIASGNFEGGKNDGAETQYLVRAADYVYTLTQSAEERVANRVTVYIDKVRLGEIASSKVKALAYLGQCLYQNENTAVRN